MTGLGLVVSFLPASSLGGPRGTGGVADDFREAGGLLAKFLKQTDNWSMPVPAGFFLFAEAFVCPMRYI